MERNERRYDYGLRGYDGRMEGRSWRNEHGAGERPHNPPRERRSEPRTPRVTARYNRDYVFGGRGEEGYPRNYNLFGGDRPDRIGDPRYMRQPYTTIAGTRTYRGSHEPMGYDRDYDGYDRDLHPFR
jgi:hypothetical protein